MRGTLIASVEGYSYTPFCLIWYNSSYFNYTTLHFYLPVFYATHDQHFPSESTEKAAYWIGFGEHCGDAMTYKHLDHETPKIIYRSAVRLRKLLLPTIGLHHMEGRYWDPQNILDKAEDPYSLHQVLR